MLDKNKLSGGIWLKKILIVVGFLTLINFSTTNIIAVEATAPIVNQEVLYDMNQGGTQTFEVVDNEGEKLVIEVEEIPNYLRSVKNGNYKISAFTTGQWKASYYITVSNNSIVKAYSPSILAYVGSFTSADLKVDNSKQSTYYIKRKVFLITTSINLRAKLLSNKISITY